MAFRKKMSGGSSRSSFSKYGSKTHRKNLSSRTVMRGGIRL